MKPTKKQIEKEEKQLKTAKIIRSSKSNQRVAKFLVKNYPKDAIKIAAGMEQAATEKGIKRRLARVKIAVASESAESSAA
jgi:hypothetical protein